MPFTLSAPITINGVTNSYELTGSGNLDDMATAAASIGFTRTGETYTFAPGTNRILAMRGTLTENRKGIRTVNIRSSGHICWSYGAASVCTLGLLDVASGVYTGSVNINYETTAFGVGGNVMTANEGRCFAGAGTFNGVSGSLTYNQTASAHLDVFDNATLVALDDFKFYLSTNSNSYSHMYKNQNRFTTTNKTAFVFIQRPMEGPANVSNVTPFFVDTGFRWLAPTGTNILRVNKPTYKAVDNTNGSATAQIHVIDPLTRWIGWFNDNSGYNFSSGIKKIFRTLVANFTDNLGAVISNATPKLVTVTSGGAVTVANFSGSSGTSEVLQSTRASGAAHNETGLGWTNEGNYSFHAVGFGYAASYLDVNVGTAYQGTGGVPWVANSPKSPYVTSAYASVVTAPFAFSTTGNGTLTVSANATVAQMAEFLFKQAYDNPDAAYWRARGHTPVVQEGADASFLAIDIVVTDGATVTGISFKTTGTVTLTNGGAISAVYADSSGRIVPITAPNLLAGSRVRLFNSTDNVEMFNGVLALAGFSQAFAYTGNKNITLTATYTNGVTAKLGLSASGIFTATGATFLDSQVDDAIYNGYGINGSTVTGFAADYVEDDVNLTVSGNFTASNLYAWWVHNLTTESGIREFFGGITALDAANLRINVATVSIYLDNITASFVYQSDTIRLFRSDGIYPARTVTTGGGGISVNWNANVYVGTANIDDAVLTLRADSAVINEGVKKASILIPHTTNLA